ncbi:MAG: hypothetical protein JKY68_00695 [Rhodospirillales bacterium]|nr:hypothetical protein [Rhodospirillales bacterium]
MNVLKTTLFLVFSALTCAVPGVVEAQGRPSSFFHPAYRGVLDKTAMDKHYLLEFLPRFKRSECLIRIDLEFEGSADDLYRAPLDILFKKYLWDHEPKAGLILIKLHYPVDVPTAVFVQFADECDRRFEIAKAMAAFANKADPRYKLTVSHDRVLPGPDTMDSGGSWTDDQESVSNTWALRRKANRGDGEAMFQLAETIDPYTGQINKYVIYLMAKYCLPLGKLRTEAGKRAQKTLSAMPQKIRAQVDDVLERFRRDSDRIGLPCRP